MKSGLFFFFMIRIVFMFLSTAGSPTRLNLSSLGMLLPSLSECLDSCFLVHLAFCAHLLLRQRKSKKLNVAKDLGPYGGPVKGDYRHEEETIAVNWYTFVRIDIGVDPSDDSYLVVRVRR